MWSFRLISAARYLLMPIDLAVRQGPATAMLTLSIVLVVLRLVIPEMCVSYGNMAENETRSRA